MENKIIVDRALGKLTLTSDDVEEMLDDKPLVDSILLMFINGKDTWENEWEAEFNKEDAKDYLLDYFNRTTNYSEEFIRKSIDNIK